jgi:hypothetical protein
LTALTVNAVASNPALKIDGVTAKRLWHVSCLYDLRKGKGLMLKISVLDGRRQRRLIVEGKLIAPWAAELRTACDRARADLDGRGFVVDVKNLTAISQEGESLLLELMNDGVKFRSGGVFTKHILRQLARRMRGNLEERKT